MYDFLKDQLGSKRTTATTTAAATTTGTGSSRNV